jgi:hypothetical protein
MYDSDDKSRHKFDGMLPKHTVIYGSRKEPISRGGCCGSTRTSLQSPRFSGWTSWDVFFCGHIITARSYYLEVNSEGITVAGNYAYLYIV